MQYMKNDLNLGELTFCSINNFKKTVISNAKLGQMQPIRECFIQIGGSQEAYQNTSKNMRRTNRSSAVITGQSVARRQSEEED